MDNKRTWRQFEWEDSLFKIAIIAHSVDEARQKGNAQLNPIQYSLVASAPRAITFLADTAAWSSDVGVVEK